MPEYGKFVEGAIARLGRQHPLVKTQFFCETVEAQAGMFPPGRQALMQGSHAARTEPEAGKTYAFLIDVAGQDESQDERGGDREQSRGRDSTDLKIVEVDMSTVRLIGKPSYLTVFRKEWTGRKPREGVWGNAGAGGNMEADADRDRRDRGGGRIVVACLRMHLERIP